MDTHIDARFSKAWSFFIANAAQLVFGALAVCFAFALIVPGPWVAVNLLGEISAALRDQRPVRWQATYERTSTFLPAWGLALAAGAAVMFGLALCAVPGVLLAIAWFHAPAFVAEGRPVFQAMGDSYRLLRKPDDWVATLLNALILAACVGATSVTALLTVIALPLALAYLALCTQDTVQATTPSAASMTTVAVPGEPVDAPA